MSECWDEGGLRAYFDRELPPEDLSRIAAHIGVCAECHAPIQRIGRARGAGVLDDERSGLRPDAARRPLPSRRVGFSRGLGALRSHLRPQPRWRSSGFRNALRSRGQWPRPQRRSARLGPFRRRRRTRPRRRRLCTRKRQRHAKAAETDYYLALDDEPIDMGVVMRVALDSAAAVQADVIFDAEGRPRAIRPVKQGSK